MIADAFKNKIFPLDDPDDFPGYVSEEDISSISESSSHSEDELKEMVTKKDKIINKELFGKHFHCLKLCLKHKVHEKTKN